jgi:hypothetical protein
MIRMLVPMDVFEPALAAVRSGIELANEVGGVVLLLQAIEGTSARCDVVCGRPLFLSDMIDPGGALANRCRPAGAVIQSTRRGWSSSWLRAMAMDCSGEVSMWATTSRSWCNARRRCSESISMSCGFATRDRGSKRAITSSRGSLCLLLDRRSSLC